MIARQNVQRVSRNRKWALAIVAGVAVLILIGVTHHSSPSSSAAGGGDGGAQVVLIASRSYCLPDPDEAKMFFSVAFSNRGDKTGTVTVTPQAHYSDGSTSSGFNVYDGIKVPPLRTVASGGLYIATLKFDYNAQGHIPLRCGVFYDAGHGMSEEIPVALEQ